MTHRSPVGPSRSDWPFPPNEFIPASRIPRDEATDEDVRRAVQDLEDGDRP